MFDIGFWELALVGVVALLVVGPERLPGLARTAGHWVGKMRRFVSHVKGEIDRELKAEELKRIMAEQAKVPSQVYEFLEDTKKDIELPSLPDNPTQPAPVPGKPPAVAATGTPAKSGHEQEPSQS